MNIYTNKFKKTLTGALLLMLLTIQVFGAASPVSVYASEQKTPEAPKQQEQKKETDDKKGHEEKKETESSHNNNEEHDDENHDAPEQNNTSTQSEEGSQQNSGNQQTQNQQGSTPITNTESAPTGEQNSKNVGKDATIQTGDANASGNITNTGNTNTAANGGSGGNGNGSTTVGNTGNGPNSTNSGSVSSNTSNTTNQQNGATLGNNLNLGATTGDNEASSNVGGNSSITSGDANVSGTIFNSVNTNVDGVAIAEFNIADDHVGDIILDFGNNNCVTCGGTGSVTASNTGNGSDSQNSSEVNNTNTDNTFQQNDATVENSMVLAADTGSNDASGNVAGDSSITTGNANVAANVVNFVNNNVAGNVLFGIVNIFGDLIGDIVLPDDPFASCTSCYASNVSAENSGNASGSNNSTNVNSTTTDNTFQYNDATIENNIIVDANTGGNSASRNVGGTSNITTGASDVNVEALNIVNSNISGGDWWLVIVNEAGQWVGKIMGVPEGQHFAGSAGTEFTVNENGEITAKNGNNGSGSTNTTNVTNENHSTTTQTNNANIVNNLDLTANTGGNSTNSNVGGNNSITTGDAHIVANIVNFVNNNIAGNGRLFVTMVNVFGSWTGDLVTPGQKKDNSGGSENNSDDNNVGGSNNNNTATTTNTSENSSPNSSSSHTSTVNTDIVLSSSDEEGDVSLAYNGSLFNVAGDDSKNDEKSVKETLSTVKGAKDTDGQMTINLAWLLAALPALPLGFVERKYGILRGAAHRLISILL